MSIAPPKLSRHSECLWLAHRHKRVPKEPVVIKGLEKSCPETWASVSSERI